MKKDEARKVLCGLMSKVNQQGKQAGKRVTLYSSSLLSSPTESSEIRDMYTKVTVLWVVSSSLHFTKKPCLI